MYCCCCTIICWWRKKLGGNVVAVSNQVDQSDVLKDKFKGVTKVGDDDVEKVAKENQI